MNRREAQTIASLLIGNAIYLFFDKIAANYVS